MVSVPSFETFTKELEWELELSSFSLKVINAKKVNKAICVEHKQFVLNGWIMTPQEEKFQKFYNQEIILVSDMDDISLAAHIEELSEIAFVARASLTAAKNEKDKRSKKNVNGSGFISSVESDDISSEAINRIATRQKGLTKLEKVRKHLIDAGVSAADADQIISAKNLRDTLAEKAEATQPVESPVSQSPEPAKPKNYMDWDKIILEAREKEASEAKPLVLKPLSFKKE